MKKLKLFIVFLMSLIQISNAYAKDMDNKDGLIWIECKYKDAEPESLSQLNEDIQILALDLKKKTAISYDYFKEKYVVFVDEDKNNINLVNKVTSNGAHVCDLKISLDRKYGYYHRSNNCKGMSDSLYKGFCKRINEPKPLF